MTILYAVTIVLFAVVIGTRYFTLKHKHRLTHRRLSFENLCKSNQQRFNAAQKERKAAEREELSVRGQAKKVAAQLEELKEELLEEDNKVSELERRIAGIKV